MGLLRRPHHDPVATFINVNIVLWLGQGTKTQFRAADVGNYEDVAIL